MKRDEITYFLQETINRIVSFRTDGVDRPEIVNRALDRVMAAATAAIRRINNEPKERAWVTLLALVGCVLGALVVVGCMLVALWVDIGIFKWLIQWWSR